MSLFHNLPEELRALRQWICWLNEDIGAAKPTKVPYNPRTGSKADVTDPSTWGTFEEALSAVHNYSGLGFVFTVNDGYAFIDLDDTKGDQTAYDRQLKVFQEFDSYSEISPSGNGLHIIVKGNIPRGRRRSAIEIYSSERYATMTGNVFSQKPITDCHDKLNQLWEQMGGGPVASNIYAGDDFERECDNTILERAGSANNGDKFIKLYKGDWREFYTSQSEADFAYIDIIAYYTQNRNQITRLFRQSALGQRDKATRVDYVNWMVNKSFDRLLPPIDLDGFKIAIENKLAGSPSGKATGFDPVIAGSTPAPAATNTIQQPPGLLGEIAEFIYRASPRPVPEIALSAAIGLMAGICGRAYNVSGTGLNQYVLLIAATGTGKEGAAQGMTKLMTAIRTMVPTSTSFIGPSEIQSAQALHKFLNKNSQCFVSILGEIGLRLQQLSNANSSPVEIGIKRMLLDLYNKSGHADVFRPSIYADRDKNIEATASPAFSLYGESTPERFYGSLNEEMISEGLLPRFTIIEYHGDRPDENEEHVNTQVPIWLSDRLASLAGQAEAISHAKKVINVDYTDEAKSILRAYNKKVDARIRGTQKDILRQLWNRAHLKVLKLSALVAVGENPWAPTITPENIEWARNIIETDIDNLTSKFERGEVGTNNSEMKQAKDMESAIKCYLTEPWDKVASYVKLKSIYDAKVIPHQYLQRKLVAIASFRTDRAGATAAIHRTLKTMVEGDRLREIPKQELTNKYGYSGKGYVLSDMRVLD